MSFQFEIAIRIWLKMHSAIEANALYGSRCEVFYWIMNLKIGIKPDLKQFMQSFVRVSSGYTVHLTKQGGQNKVKTLKYINQHWTRNQWKYLKLSYLNYHIQTPKNHSIKSVKSPFIQVVQSTTNMTEMTNKNLA